MTNQMEIINVENELVSHLTTKLARNPPISANPCIFRVPTTLRKYNTHLFEPNLVSIGPYHRHVPKLQPMQEIKEWYLKCLIDRAPTPETSIQCFTKSIMDNVNHCLDCYADKVEMSVNEFVETMVIDGCFLIEFFRKCEDIGLQWRREVGLAKSGVPQFFYRRFTSTLGVQSTPTQGLVHPNDPLFRTCWMCKTLLTDLLLLENQLPWFVLDCLFNLTAKGDELPLPQLAHDFFSWNILRSMPMKVDSRMASKHLLDLQRNIILSGHGYNTSTPSAFISIPCVTELLQAGVKFEVGDLWDQTKIEFKNGVLRIPPIVVLDNAESFFRNLIAYEQCDYSLNDTLSSYIGFFDNLINSGEDLDHLRHKKIVICFLGSKDVSGFFNGLYKDVDITRSPYTNLTMEINRYCESRWRKWRTILSRDYFHTPWSIMSVAAAIVILVLTFLQTFFTIKQ